MLRHSATEYKPRRMCDVWWPAVGPFFILMHFVTFTFNGSHKYLLTCGSKRAIPSPTISPNQSRNAGSFFSFELLKYMDMYRLQVINRRSQITHHRFVAIALPCNPGL